MNYSDLKRAERFIAELKRFEAEGEMPRLQILRLPNDHTHGASRGWRTPTAYVAENDLALGQIVEAVSHSKFWPQTAIFVVEDDAQNGPDHVDAHRTTAFVISPYTKRGVVDFVSGQSAGAFGPVEDLQYRRGLLEVGSHVHAVGFQAVGQHLFEAAGRHIGLTVGLDIDGLQLRRHTERAA